MNEPRPRIPPSLAPHASPDGRSAAGAWPDDARPARRSRWQRARRTLAWMLLVLLLFALVPPATVLAMRWWSPPTTSFMLRSAVQPVAYRWVPRAQHPEALRRAVVAAEDQKFWTHWGFDFVAIAEALEHNEKSRRKRGASTISQQTAKNLFLWPSRSWLRKGLEVSFTLLLEAFWSKERILEVYLNVAEFGPGVYGVEAAARKFFGKSAAGLSAAECAQLAAVLPNPRKWRADRPGPYVQSRVDWILAHIGESPRFSTAPAEAEPQFSTFGDEPDSAETSAEGAEMPAADEELPVEDEAFPAADEELPAADDDAPTDGTDDTAPPASTEHAAPPADDAPVEPDAEPSTESGPPGDEEPAPMTPDAPEETPRYAP